MGCCVSTRSQDLRCKDRSALLKGRDSRVLLSMMNTSVAGLPSAGLMVIVLSCVGTFTAPAQSQENTAPSPLVVAQVTPADGPAIPPRGLEHADFYRARELTVLMLQLELERAANSRWQPAAAALGLGISSVIAGSVAFSLAWRNSYDDCYDCGTSQSLDRTGLVLIPLGALVTLVSAPLLIVRVARHRRLKRIEQTIERLGGTLSLERKGLAARFRF